MTRIPTSEFFRNAPQVFKVSLQGIVIDGIDDASELDGDYLLQLARETSRQLLWKLNFPETCGFTSISLSIGANRSAGYELRVSLQGLSSNRPTWVERNVRTVTGPFSPVAESDSTRVIAGSVQVMPVTSTLPSQSYKIAASSDTATMIRAAGMEGSGGTGRDICLCEGCNFEKYTVQLVGVVDGDCASCDTMLSSPTVIPSGWDACDWQEQFRNPDGGPGLCDTWFWVGVFVHRNANCELEMRVSIDGDAVPLDWKKVVDSCMTRQELPIWQTPDPPGDTVCDFSASVAVVEPVNPDNLTELDLADCLAMQACGPKVECLPPPELNFNCGFNITCCCPNCQSVKQPQLPGTTCGTTAGCTEQRSLNVSNGNLSLALSVPNSGPTAPATAITVNSSPRFAQSSSTGNGTASYFNQKVVEIDAETADIRKCDGSAERYFCKDTSGNYKPWYNVTGSLKQNYDAGGFPTGWTEIAADGNTYQYDATGQLTSVTNSCGETWTMHRSSPLSYISDAYNRRTTYSYDTSGALESIQDVHGRVTTFVVDANGNLTKRITPELCITEIVYDANDLPIAVVEPDGCRTSFSYDENDWCNGIQEPSGARYTYSYLNWGSTAITDPAGNVTTVSYDAARHITGVTDPLGNTTSYSYWRDFVRSYEMPTGNRVSLSYTTLANGAPPT